MDLTNYKEVTALLERHGFRFSKSLGQNFLTAAWVPRRIAEEALIAPGDGVLEVGPGVGCLTVELAEKAERVLALELDERLRGVLSETLSERPNVSVVFADAVKADLRSLCGEYFGGRPVRVCANLPYNVTSPLLTAFLKAGCFESVTVMVQKEVAARLCARPGTAEYGAFTLLVQWYAEAEKLFDVPPDCFMPRPKVTSTVIRLCRRPSPPVRVRDEEFFFAVVRAAFNQRRKTLVNAVSAGMRNVERADVEKALTEMGLSPTVRGEALSAEQFAVLSDTLYTPNAG
jgi:16S rRNA (adenine1518-N6/adenine1519-N6)-dimethyltransferase